MSRLGDTNTSVLLSLCLAALRLFDCKVSIASLVTG
jgi:hypothetical protein